MKHNITIPSYFDASQSVLGRALARHFGDWRRANSVRIVMLVLAPVVAGLLCYLIGVVNSDLSFVSVADERLLAGFGAATVILLLLGAFGWTSRTLVSFDGDRITIEPDNGGDLANSGWTLEGCIELVIPVSIEQYHAHYSRFRGVRKFGRARGGDSLILILTSTEQIILAIPPMLYLEIEPVLSRFATSDLIAA